MARAVHATTFGNFQEEDKLIWTGDRNGVYSVKSGYKIQVLKPSEIATSHPHSSMVIGMDIWKGIWSLRVPPKIKHFVWRAVNNILATNGNRFHRHLSTSPLCPVCESYPESVEHALFLCHWASMAWFSHPLGYVVNVQTFTSINAWLEAFLMNIAAANSSIACQVAFLLWEIWKKRCDFVFNAIVPNPIFTANSAARAAFEFLAIPCNLRKPHHTIAPDSSSKWCSPPPGEIKINTDAAWDADSLTSGLAAIARNSNGEFLSGMAVNTVASSSLAAEAQAIKLGLSLANSLSLSSFLLESDSLVLISALKNPLSAVDWSASHIVTKIRNESVSFQRVNWLWTSRMANSAADLVAGMAKRGVCPDDWSSNPSPSLLHLFMIDALLEPH